MISPFLPRLSFLLGKRYEYYPTQYAKFQLPILIIRGLITPKLFKSIINTPFDAKMVQRVLTLLEASKTKIMRKNC